MIYNNWKTDNIMMKLHDFVHLKHPHITINHVNNIIINSKHPFTIGTINLITLVLRRSG